MTEVSQSNTSFQTFPVPVIVPAPAPSAPTDEECLKRVEQMLDTTELALAVVADEMIARETAIGWKLTVAIPVFNERSTIREIVRRVQDVPLDMEIIIVDDGSTDGTRDILRELEAEDGVRVIYHEFNHGKGAALRTAFMEAAGDIVLVQDADLEYDPNDYLRLVEPLLEGRADVVYGSRYLGRERQNQSILHRWGNRVLTGASNLLNRQRLTDMETCYKVFRREVLADMDIREDRFGFEPEITAKLARRRARICEVPIRYNGRGYSDGKKIGLADACSALRCIVRYAIAD